jgi:hypothetical protein
MIVGNASFLFQYDTTTSVTSGQLFINFDGTPLGFGSVSPGGSFNGQYLKLGNSASNAVFDSSGSAHTVTLTANVDIYQGAVDVASANLSVFAFGNPN